MKKVTVTLKFEFDTEETDDETVTQLIVDAFEERIENNELLESGAKVKIVDAEPDEDEDPEIEDDED